MNELSHDAPRVGTGLMSSDVYTYIFVIWISVWAGIVSFFESKKTFALLPFLAHISSASFAGMMAFFGCEYAGISGPLTGVVCGVAAHMGTPALIRLAMKLKVVRNIFEEKP